MGFDDADRYARRYRSLGVKGITSQTILFGGEQERDADVRSAGAFAVIPIMGQIGAGAEILPEFEQVPPDGLDQVELPFQVPPDMIGFTVKGDSMLPKYDEGDVIIVHREQQRSTTSLIGELAAIRTGDGRRYLKRIMHGPRRGVFSLESTNARTIEATIVWASEIFAIVPARQLRKFSKPARKIKE